MIMRAHIRDRVISIVTSEHPFGYVAARQVDKAIREGNDGVIYKNLYDPFLADNYGVFDLGSNKVYRQHWYFFN